MRNRGQLTCFKMVAWNLSYDQSKLGSKRIETAASYSVSKVTPQVVISVFYKVHEQFWMTRLTRRRQRGIAWEFTQLFSSVCVSRQDLSRRTTNRRPTVWSVSSYYKTEVHPVSWIPCKGFSSTDTKQWAKLATAAVLIPLSHSSNQGVFQER